MNGKFLKLVPKKELKIKNKHRCMPPRNKECPADKGSIWECECGQKWKCTGRHFYLGYPGYDHPIWGKKTK